jgi:peroxiredoxin
MKRSGMIRFILAERQSMKRLVYFTLTMFFVLIAQAAGKQNFTISGKTLSSSHKVVVYDFALHELLETVTVKDGAFTYTGSGYAGTYLELIDEHGKKSNLIIIDGEELSLDMVNDKISGSPINEELYSVAHKAYELHHDKKDSVARSYLLERIEANKNNMAPVYWIYRYYHILGHETVKDLMKGAGRYTHSNARKHVDRITARIDLENALLGKPFKEFTLKDLTGAKHKMSEYIGKDNYVLMDYWASWCSLSISEIPYIKSAYEQYHSRGFNVVGISLDEDKKKLLSAAIKYDLPWVTLCDFYKWDSAAALAYDVHSIPFNLLLDGEGKIIAVNLRGKALGRKLKELYGREDGK